MRILVVDDDRAFRAAFLANLRELPHEFLESGDPVDALKVVEECDLLLTDVHLPRLSGIELMREARRLKPGIEVVIMTGHATIDLAVKATREGARAFLEKPFEIEDLFVHLREVEKVVKLRDAAGRGGRGRLVGSSPEMRRVYEAIDAAAGSEATVLVTGATGSGKEAAAEAIHQGSHRASGPFIAINLGAVPRDLAESELFGAMPGAYTGIRDRRMGRFELARGGTLFLDEINSLPLEIQPKILRAIETKEVWPLGAQKAVSCDVRILAAANEDLELLVREGRFREDLYYRLHVLAVSMPSLKDRPGDIPAIAESLLEGLRREGSRVTLTGDALAALMQRDWPGNVRELRNVLERALALKGRGMGAHGNAAGIPGKASAPGNGTGMAERTLTAEELGLVAPDLFDLPYRKGRIRAAEEWSKRTIRAALAHTHGNVSEAARLLKMSRTSLIALIGKHRLR